MPVMILNICCCTSEDFTFVCFEMNTTYPDMIGFWAVLLHASACWHLCVGSAVAIKMQVCIVMHLLFHHLTLRHLLHFSRSLTESGNTYVL